MDNVISMKFQKAIKQSNMLRAQALLDNNESARLLEEAKERKENISDREDVELITKKRKKNDVISFGHIKVKYLKSEEVRVYLHPSTDATLRLVKGESGDIIEVLENNAINFKK